MPFSSHWVIQPLTEEGTGLILNLKTFMEMDKPDNASKLATGYSTWFKSWAHPLSSGTQCRANSVSILSQQHICQSSKALPTRTSMSNTFSSVTHDQGSMSWKCKHTHCSHYQAAHRESATKQASKDMINNQQSTCLIPEACQCARIEQQTHNEHNYCHISSWLYSIWCNNRSRPK
jgi:hypothetical protein